MINFFCDLVKSALFWGIVAVILGFVALRYEILHQRGLERLQKRDDPFSKGVKLMGENKWAEAISELREAMKEAEAVYLVKLCNLIGLCYSNLGEPNSALETYKLCLSLANSLNDKKGEAFALCSLGRISENRGKWRKALRYFERALEIFTQIGAQKEIKITKRNIQELKKQMESKS
jgi:tetratricopeptide (TPR) repeat protein